ncbi:hypothetical protein NHX12_033945 [Muraenolepis orangiensis]|uniref:Uncharacterized protein n=1 Tax=Muraenolepis orangiensis TaxID=630683 RepID=A0A9Q0E4Y6_9TELE|nr:hypothetical protein NHX12_033945 [Muraenolepis orangiensis]
MRRLVYYRSTTGLLQAYYRPATGLLQAYYRPTTGLLQACYRPTTGLLQACYRPTTGLLQAYYRPATGLLQAYYRRPSVRLLTCDAIEGATGLRSERCQQDITKHVLRRREGEATYGNGSDQALLCVLDESPRLSERRRRSLSGRKRPLQLL